MARKTKLTSEPQIRLSPGEVDQLIHDAMKKAKLTRLKQVREQSAQLAETVNQNVERCWNRELAVIQERAATAAQQRRKETAQQLEIEVLECLTNLGKAHAKAQKQVNPRVALEAKRKRNGAVARVRGELASEVQRNEQLRVLKEKNAAVETRRRALEVEQVRSAYVVAMAPPSAPSQKAEAKVELPKVIFFDRKSLYQSEYIPTDVIVKEDNTHTNAREAAEREEQNKLELEREREKKKWEAEAKIAERGRAALSKEKVHLNYLRLLKELDKLESKDNSDAGRWELPSTSSFSDKSTTAQDIDSAIERSCSDSSPQQDVDEVPVRDQLAEKESSPQLPRPTYDCTSKLEEIGQLFEELRLERERFLLEDQIELPIKTTSAKISSPSDNSEDSNLGDKLETPDRIPTAPPAKEKLLEKKVYELDGCVRVGFEVLEKKDTFSEMPRRSLPEKERQKIPKILEAIRRERKQLEAVFLSQKKLSTPQQRPPSSLATSTPVDRTNPAEGKRDLLKHYALKLLNMRREQVPQVSVSSSSSGSSLPLGADAFIFAPQETPTSSLRSSRSAERSSKLSERSTRSSKRSSEGSPALTMNPLIDIYNEVYEAFNQRASLLKQQVTSLRQERQRLESTPEESTFESLHLSQTTSDFSRSVQDSWTHIQSFSKQGFESSTSSELPERDHNTDVSSEISMPDVDAALRRLGLPSMQTVLRR